MALQIHFNPKDIAAYPDMNQLYTSDSIKFIVKRQCEFLRQHPYGTYKAALIPLIWTATGGMVGYKVATVTADHFKVDKGKGTVQGGGIVIGCAIGAYLYASISERNLFFKTWKVLRLESITNSFVFAKHHGDEFLKQFVDCIYYTPIKVPVRLATGNLIDLDTLKSIKPNREGDYPCPHTRAKLDLNNPNIDLELHTLIMKRIQFLLQGDLEHLDPKSLDYQATKLQLCAIESRLVAVHEQHIKGLETLQSEGKITVVESNRLRAQFFQYFGTDPIGKADPENGVDAHVMDFTLNWKKVISEHSKFIFKGTPPTQFEEDV